MKTFALVLSLVAITPSAMAEEGAYETALKETLNSAPLSQLKAEFLNSLELTKVDVHQATSSRPRVDSFEVTLFYSAVGTAGGCYVQAKANRSQMEIVSPGGGGLETRYIWNVSAVPGTCLR